MGADHWDERKLDFVPAILPAGVASPFVIKLSTFTLAFQVRLPTIRVTSFTGALRSLLREQTGEAWDISSPTSHKSFDEWRGTVARIIRLNVRLPSSDKTEIPAFDGLLKESHVESASMVLRSEQGLETGADAIRQLLDHIDHGHFHASATGVRENGEIAVETVWDSELEGESLITAVAVDSGTGEAAFSELFAEAEFGGSEHLSR